MTGDRASSAPAVTQAADAGTDQAANPAGQYVVFDRCFWLYLASAAQGLPPRGFQRISHES